MRFLREAKKNRTIETKIFKTLKELCSYKYISDYEPVGAGPLLKKYGKKCDYSIRDKYIEVKSVEDDIVILWETQETPIKPAITMIKAALKTISEDLDGYTIKIKVWDRDGEEHASSKIEF